MKAVATGKRGGVDRFPTVPPPQQLYVSPHSSLSRSSSHHRLRQIAGRSD